LENCRNKIPGHGWLKRIDRAESASRRLQCLLNAALLAVFVDTATIESNRIDANEA
jgi:hypothetical protein